MESKIKKLWSDLKVFDWKMYCALCLFALIPAVYQTVVTRLIADNSNAGALDIVGQMEWFDLIDETIRAFLIVPMYHVLAKAKTNGNLKESVFKTGIVVFGLYALFSIGTFFYGISLIRFMNPNEIDVTAAYRYLSLETIAFMIGIIFNFTGVVFLIIDKALYMYLFLALKLLLSTISDFALIPNTDINGVAVANIIANSIMGLISVAVLIYIKQIKVSGFNKNDIRTIKDIIRIGSFAGGQQFLDNIIYALMIVRMVNSVSESGNYWVANNFIWGWLLIPVTYLSEIIRKDAAVNGYKIKQTNYYSIVIVSIIIWFVLIPSYRWFFGVVEGIGNPERIFEIVIKNLGFYIAYAFSQIPGAIFVGMGKTRYNAINSLICNIVYYGIWFVFFRTGSITMNMDTIIIMFGCGNIVHWLVSIAEEKIFLKKELSRQ